MTARFQFARHVSATAELTAPAAGCSPVLVITTRGWAPVPDNP